MLVSSKEFLDIQANIYCRFTLKRTRDMIITYKSLVNSRKKSNFGTLLLTHVEFENNPIIIFTTYVIFYVFIVVIY